MVGVSGVSGCKTDTRTMVNVLKFRTLYSIPFWPKFCFLCSCFLKYLVCLFVCVEVLRPSQRNGVMSSVVSLPNHTFTGQA